MMANKLAPASHSELPGLSELDQVRSEASLPKYTCLGTKFVGTVWMTTDLPTIWFNMVQLHCFLLGLLVFFWYGLVQVWASNVDLSHQDTFLEAFSLNPHRCGTKPTSPSEEDGGLGTLVSFINWNRHLWCHISCFLRDVQDVYFKDSNVNCFFV